MEKWPCLIDLIFDFYLGLSRIFQLVPVTEHACSVNLFCVRDYDSLYYNPVCA